MGNSSNFNDSIKDIIDSLRKCQEIKKNPKYSSLDYLYRNEARAGQRVCSIKYSSNYGFVESFINDMAYCIRNISDDEMLRVDSGYQFPSRDTIEYYHDVHDKYEKDHFINESKETIDLALDEIYSTFDEGNKNKKNVCITGKVGSGKSSFVQYMARLIRNKKNTSGKSPKIISVIISYEDVNYLFDKNLNKDLWGEEFDKIIFDQVIINGFSEISNKSEEVDEIRQWVAFEKEHGCSGGQVVSEINYLVEGFFGGVFNFEWLESYIKRKDDGENDFKYVSRSKIFYYLVTVLGYKILIVFDGFDTFSVDKFVNESSSAIVQYFKDVVFRGEDVLSLNKNQYSCILLLRDCTYSRLMKLLSKNDRDSVIRMGLCPVGVKKILYRGVRSYYNRCFKNKKSSHDVDKFLKVFDRIHEEIKSEFCSDDDEVVKIFNQNYRRLKEFYILLLRQIVCDVIQSVGYIDTESKFFSHILKSKPGRLLESHNLMELLILKDYKVFSNYFTSIEIGDDGKWFHGETNHESGLIDNIFSYHFIDYSMYAEFPLTLIKIRILQFLISEGKHVNSEEIKDELFRIGYNFPVETVRTFLQIMGESGFVKSRWSKVGRDVVFKETSLGFYVINMALFNNRYVEHTIQRTMIPIEIRSLMRPSCKYIGNITDLDGWIYSSIVNFYIFRHYVRSIESFEKSGLNSDEVKRFDEVYSLERNFDNMISGLEHVFLSRKSMCIKIPALLKSLEASRKDLLCIYGGECENPMALNFSIEDKMKNVEIFVCHASDDKRKVRNVVRYLKKEGFNAWLDEEELLPGVEWRNVIPKVLSSVDVVLVCLSKMAIQKSGYIQKEIRYALDFAKEKPEGTIYIIPLKLEACDAPDSLTGYQVANWYERNGVGKSKLLKVLREIQSGVSQS